MKLLQNTQKRVIDNQQGFASVVIALILILVMGLMSVGFAQLARREQQNALTKQQATQAYYAAESGVNDVVKALPELTELAKTPTPPFTKNQCIPPNILASILGGPPTYSSVNNSTGVSYSCAIVNLRPPNLVWQPVPSEGSRSSTFSTTQPLNELTVNWSSVNGRTNFRPSLASKFSPAVDGKWDAPAVLQVSITPLGSLTRTALINRTFTAYLYPTTTGGSVTYNPGGDQAPIVGGNCSAATKLCKVKIDGIGGAANEYFLVRIVNYYDDSNIAIDEARTVAGVKVDFVDGQAQVDVTGKARTVLKRVQVRVNIVGDGDEAGVRIEQPDYTIEAGDICKRAATYPALTQYIGVDGSPYIAGGNQDCNLNNY